MENTQKNVKTNNDENIFEIANGAMYEENAVLKNSNNELQKSIVAITAQYKDLLTKYVNDVFRQNSLQIPKNIDWSFCTADIVEKSTYIGVFGDKKVIVDLSNDNLIIEEIVRKKIGYGPATTTAYDDQELMPPIPDNDNVPLPEEPIENETTESMYFNSFKNNLVNALNTAKEQGNSDAYLNADGSVCSPSNFAQNKVGSIFNKSISLDEWDEVVDLIIEDFNCNIIEDLNCISFSLENYMKEEMI